MGAADELRFLVHREGIESHLPIEAGQEVTTYELGEPWPYRDLPPHSGCSQELVDYQNAVLDHANGPADWRVERSLNCDCRQRRTVAQVLVHRPSARKWVTAKPERVPSAFRKDVRVNGWVLHGREGEAPHVGAVASCKGCDKRWLIISFVDDAMMLPVKAATHGAQVVP